MSDLFKDSLAKASGGSVVGNSLVNGLGHFASIRTGFDAQARELDRMVINVHVGISEELPLKIVGAPTDDAGSAEFVTQVADQFDSQFGPRVRNPEVNLQFFDPAFHVRPFASGDGFVSHRDPASVAKGRPAGRLAA